MLRVRERLKARERSLAWLGRQLSPPVRRQTISDWCKVPERHLKRVARLLNIRPDDLVDPVEAA